MKKPTNWTLLLILTGILLRLAATAYMDVQQDGNAYATMGGQLAKTGTLWMPWGDGLGATTGPAPSHHYPPLYPAYLALFYSQWGFHVNTTKAANLLLSITAILIIYATTRNLYGAKVAGLLAGLFAVIPRFIMATGTGFSENLVAVVFTLTLWAGLRGLKEPRYLVLAGIFAGLSFLTRSGMGPFFFIGIAAGLAWRLKYAGTRGTFTNKSYLVGGLCFIALAGSWSLRNWNLFGDWQSTVYITWATQQAIQHPIYLSLGILFKLAQYILVLTLFYAVFQPEARAAWKQRAQENVSLLWMTVGLVVVLGILISGLIWAVERSPPFWMDSERYLAMAYVPLLWLFLKDTPQNTPKQDRNLRVRYLSLCAIFVLASAFYIARPTQSPEDHAAAALQGILKPGDTLGIQNSELGRYSFYPYLPTHDHIKLVLCNGNGTNPCGEATPSIILGVAQVNDPHYSLIRQDTIEMWPFGHGKIVNTYRRNP